MGFEKTLSSYPSDYRMEGTAQPDRPDTPPVSPPEISAHGEGRGFVLQAMTVPGTVMIAAQAGCRFVCRESGIVECLCVAA